jgi:hypothetical protein
MVREGLRLPLQERRREVQVRLLPGERAWRVLHGAGQASEAVEGARRRAGGRRSPDVAACRPIPWQNYDREWDWIESADGILLNFAGCLDREEIHRREDEGVARAMELVASYLDRAEPVALTTTVVQHVHAELMGAIYPFAGQWRTVSLHKGDGPTKWPLPPGGIEPQMAVMERDRVLTLALRLG